MPCLFNVSPFRFFPVSDLNTFFLNVSFFCYPPFSISFPLSIIFSQFSLIFMFFSSKSFLFSISSYLYISLSISPFHYLPLSIPFHAQSSPLHVFPSQCLPYYTLMGTCSAHVRWYPNLTSFSFWKFDPKLILILGASIQNLILILGGLVRHLVLKGLIRHLILMLGALKRHLYQTSRRRHIYRTARCHLIIGINPVVSYRSSIGRGRGGGFPLSVGESSLRFLQGIY